MIETAVSVAHDVCDTIRQGEVCDPGRPFRWGFPIEDFAARQPDGVHQVAAIQYDPGTARARTLQCSLEMAAKSPARHLEQQNVLCRLWLCLGDDLSLVQVNRRLHKLIGNCLSNT